MLTPHYILSGHATFTVANPNGRHFTYRVREFHGSHLVWVLAGPRNDCDRDYAYVGKVAEGAGVFPTITLTTRSRYTEDALCLKVARWALRVIWSGEALPPGYSIEHDGRCRRCGRKLTTPESIARGLGPECAEQAVHA